MLVVLLRVKVDSINALFRKVLAATGQMSAVVTSALATVSKINKLALHFLTVGDLLSAGVISFRKNWLLWRSCHPSVRNGWLCYTSSLSSALFGRNRECSSSSPARVGSPRERFRSSCSLVSRSREHSIVQRVRFRLLRLFCSSTLARGSRPLKLVCSHRLHDCQPGLRSGTQSVHPDRTHVLKCSSTDEGNRLHKRSSFNVAKSHHRWTAHFALNVHSSERSIDQHDQYTYDSYSLSFISLL